MHKGINILVFLEIVWRAMNSNDEVKRSFQNFKAPGDAGDHPVEHFLDIFALCPSILLPLLVQRKIRVDFITT